MTEYEFSPTTLTEVEQEYEDRPIQVPCKIHLKSGRVLVVKDVGAWQYTDEGFFATGYWQGTPFVESDGPEMDLLIPHGSIDFIDLDYAALEAFRNAEDGATEAVS